MAHWGLGGGGWDAVTPNKNKQIIDNLLLLYCNLFTSELEYASPVWNNITATDTNKLERVPAEVCRVRLPSLFPHIPYNYACAPAFL